MNAKVGIAMGLLLLVLVALPPAAKLMWRNAGQTETRTDGTVFNLVSIDGHPVPYAPMHGGGQAPEVSGGSLTINTDGTFACAINFSDARIVVPGDRPKEPGTYTREGNELTLKHPGAGYTPATVDGDKITMNNEGMLFVFQK